MDNCRTESEGSRRKKIKRPCSNEHCGWEAIGDEQKSGLQCEGLRRDHKNHMASSEMTDKSTMEFGRVRQKELAKSGDEKRQCDGVGRCLSKT